jgi:hypothetical protein
MRALSPCGRAHSSRSRCTGDRQELPQNSQIYSEQSGNHVRLAREGKIKEFTGISAPYDVPQNPELSVETEDVDVDNCAHQVLLKLESMGLISS